MKGPAAFTLLALLGMITSAFARIGDTPAQLKERYGEPIAESVDKDGYDFAYIEQLNSKKFA